MNPGSIVTCRNREWVLLPSDDPAVILLRPLTGATDDVVAVHRQLSDLIGGIQPQERVRSATFRLPTVSDINDAGSAHLLWQAARLTLREGATPFRSLGRISVRPRVYQFVPLLMALRLDPIRLFIADDVGVGKTIEALLIAREMLDRGEIKRVCVLTPPSLCEQWQTELSQKMNLDAVVIRSGTVSQLERRKAGSESIYRYYPIQIASIDFVKSERNRHLFLQDCPEMVIVDEAHGAATAVGDQNQQQRHELLRDLSATGRHLILLTATPHSGVEASFRSLLSLLDPAFGQWDLGALTDTQRKQLAQHYVQRTRKDIESGWETDHCFPSRDPEDRTYSLSAASKMLFDRTFAFCTELVRTSASLDQRRQRVRFWSALALLRCVMSSPAAAIAALEARQRRLAETGADDQLDFTPQVFESSTERVDDEQPLAALEAGESTLDASEKKRLRELSRLAASTLGNEHDTKAARCIEILGDLLDRGCNPIVWCRYIATANYLAEQLSRAWAKTRKTTQVVAVTSQTGDDDTRRSRIAAIKSEQPRVLIATDCLSEGINLQELFDAALHYDLPWNPNRLEQREGRVDRYGQPSPTVKTFRYFGADNPVDGVVIDVLLNKAREIHKALGTHVPVPVESETVTQAVMNALFLRGQNREPSPQLALDLSGDGLPPEVRQLHDRWDRDADRERVNRTRFAQRAIKPDEVRREIEATDNILGDPDAVREFVLSALQRLSLTVVPDKRVRDVFHIPAGEPAAAGLPAAVQYGLPSKKEGLWTVTFTSPNLDAAKMGAEFIGRNHQFVATLARFLMEEALTKSGEARASRCGVLRTYAVEQETHLFLLRLRHLVEQPQRVPMLAEEVMVAGYRVAARQWLDESDAMALLAKAHADANMDRDHKSALASRALADWPTALHQLKTRIDQRASELEESHKRIRQAVQLRVRQLKVVPQLPPDLLGLLVLDPLARR